MHHQAVTGTNREQFSGQLRKVVMRREGEMNTTAPTVLAEVVVYSRCVDCQRESTEFHVACPYCFGDMYKVGEAIKPAKSQEELCQYQTNSSTIFLHVTC